VNTLERVALSHAEARSLTDEVKNDAERLWRKLVELYEGRAHLTLGYSSWGAYFKDEFGGSRRKAYYLLDAGRVARELESSAQLCTPNEGQARELAPLKNDPAALRADWPVLCDVYEGMTFEDACEQFLKLNDGLLVTAYEKFDKGVKAGRYECIETKKVIESCGFRVANNVRDGNLVCVAAAVDVFKLDQGDALRRALTWGSAAWGHTPQATDGYVLRGLGLIARAYSNGEIDDAALVKKLAKHGGGAASLTGSAKSARNIKGGSLARNLANIIVDVYNKGRRSGALGPV